MRAFVLLALLASTQAINLRDEGKPVKKDSQCQTNSDGITFCLDKGKDEWTIDMNHIDRKKKSYETISLPGPSGRKDSPPPRVKNPKTPFADDAVEAAKKAKKEALLQAAARAQKKSEQEIAMLAHKNVTANATMNVTSNVNISGNATTWPQNWTQNFAAQKNTTLNVSSNATKLAQGVPVHVNPVVLKDTLGEAKLDMKMLIGPDEVELKKKNAKK